MEAYMNAVYMQQYMAQCQYMSQIMNKINESPKESSPEKKPVIPQAPVKKVKLSFGIDEILSPDFGYSSSTSSTASSSSRSPSPQLEQKTEEKPQQDEASLLALQLLSQIQKQPKMKAPKSTNSKNVNRARTIFSDEQLDELERTFAANQYLIGEERVRLAAKLDLNVKQVKIWFQNRRIKHRRSVSTNHQSGNQLALNDSNPSLAPSLNESSQSDCSESSLHIVEM